MDQRVRQYFQSVPQSRRGHLGKLHSLILGCFPKATVDMKHKMPTYTYGDGWVAIANQKNHVSLYTCSPAHLAAFKARHPGYKTGKGCINFRDKDVIPASAVRTVVRHAILRPKGA